MNLAAALRIIVGGDGVLTDAEVAMRPAAWGLPEPNRAGLLVRPRSTDEVAAVLALCHRRGRAVVSQGGVTGLARGCVNAPGDVILSTERMRAIETLDPVGATLQLQAGVVLANAQACAEAQGLLLALDLGARGSATIGGLIATNAGGNRALRYGTMREQVLGLEVVLADGTVVSSLNTLLKNNAGYDWKHWFIGSEGTLGVITRAVLRLRPAPRSRQAALVALDGFAAVVELLELARLEFGADLSAFEAMWRGYYAEVTARGVPPLPASHPFYVLLETQGVDADHDAARFERVLLDCLQRGVCADGAIARSLAETEAFWAIREGVGELLHLMPFQAFDIGLPVARMEPYLAALEMVIAQRWPQGRCFAFGHLGDGNLHLIVAVGSDDADTRHQVETLVYERLQPIGGTVSAEHGIGLEKKAALPFSRSAAELQLMRRLKAALDPSRLLNPGKILD